MSIILGQLSIVILFIVILLAVSKSIVPDSNNILDSTVIKSYKSMQFSILVICLLIWFCLFGFFICVDA